jgi:hypothetical protein
VPRRPSARVLFLNQDFEEQAGKKEDEQAGKQHLVDNEWRKTRRLTTDGSDDYSVRKRVPAVIG